MPDKNAQTAKSIFEKTFLTHASHVFTAPGRVNIIGEHTDYNDGFVLPCAISFNTAIACKINDQKTMRAVAANYDNEQDEFSINATIEKSDKHWTNYLRGVVAQFVANNHPIGGIDIAICGNIPQGTGLSSSASLEVCLAMAINEVFKLGLSNKELAQLCQRAENDFVGCHCGIMDQLISACGEENSALLIDCRDLSTKTVSIPDGLQLIIINPNVERKLVGSEYNARRKSCEKAAQMLGVAALRDGTLEALEKYRDKLDQTTYKRARHVITENTRVQQMLTACFDNDFATIKTLISDSHASMREDFEITTPQLDFIADFINGTESFACARMTGGGFGGCAVALIPINDVSSLCQSLKDAYERTFKTPLTIYIAEISEGAQALESA